MSHLTLMRQGIDMAAASYGEGFDGSDEFRLVLAELEASDFKDGRDAMRHFWPKFVESIETQKRLATAMENIAVALDVFVTGRVKR